MKVVVVDNDEGQSKWKLDSSIQDRPKKNPITGVDTGEISNKFNNHIGWLNTQSV